jgi:hypothetical protein
VLVSLHARLAYLALPKTATQAFERALDPLCDIRFHRPPQVKHMTVRAFERFMRPYLARIGAGDVETFCVVREPVDWLGSWYRYRSRAQNDGSVTDTRRVSFAEFVEGYLATPQPHFARLGGIASFTGGRGGVPAVAHMFRYDNLPAAADFLGARFGQKIELPMVNVSPKAELVLPPELLARLERERAEDFAAYAAAR